MIVAALALPLTAAAQSASQSAPARQSSSSAPARDVAAPQDQEETTGLLLPAVQNVRRPAGSEPAAPTAAPGSVAPAPQKGVEPDEIDVATSVASPRAAQVRELDKSSPKLAERAAAGGGSMSVQQMMLKLKPRQGMMVATKPGGATSTANSVQAKPQEPPKYEIADCGTAVSPMICCHHEAGDGSSCNLFKILCENAGGTAQGDGESAACSDW